MINYSIIIPHKNIPDLLQRCLDSIPIRDDVQVIVIDDNSDPSIVDFSSFPGISRPDVETIFTKEGKGAGYARNVGIDHAKGKWVIFADADDFFNYCINSVMNDYASADCDVVYCNASSLDTEMYFNSNRSRMLNDYHNKDDFDPSKEYYLRYVWGEPWGKLIKLSLLRQNCIKCEETRIHNDTQLSYLVGANAKTIHIEKRAVYCVTDRDGSISKQIDPENLFTRLKVFCKKYCELKKYGIDEFEDYFILSPFETFRANGDEEKLKKCYEIVSMYGIEPYIIDEKIERNNRKLRRAKRINKLRKLQNTVIRFLTVTKLI